MPNKKQKKFEIPLYFRLKGSFILNSFLMVLFFNDIHFKNINILLKNYSKQV